MKRPARLCPETQRQMELVWEHAQEDWKDAALSILRALALRQRILTSLDVLNELERQGYETHELRAIGPVMAHGAKEGWIEHKQFIRRNDNHNRGSTVEWRSLLYGMT